MTTDDKVMSTCASSIFTPYQVDRLGQCQRFLIHIQDLDIARIAFSLGYGSDEQAFAQENLAIAQGRNVPFDHSLSEAQRRLAASAPSAQLERIRAIDRFENTWFPRSRTALARFIAADQFEAFNAAFFEDLQMQPEGPGVVSSVERWLDRVEALPQSKVPGASEAYDSLVKRGLTKTTVKHMRALLAESRQDAPAPAAPLVKPERIAAIAAERVAAYDRLNKWYTDWAETLRSELSYHQAVRLGVAAAKGGRKSTPEEPSPAPVKPVDE